MSWVRLFLLSTVVMLRCLPSLCQSPPAKRSSENASPSVVAAKRTPEQERGLRLLNSAEAEAAGLQPDMRAFVLWRASYAYVSVDPKKGERLTKDAFTATETIEEPADPNQCGNVGSAGDIKSWIQERVLSDMITKDHIP